MDLDLGKLSEEQRPNDFYHDNTIEVNKQDSVKNLIDFEINRTGGLIFPQKKLAQS